VQVMHIGILAHFWSRDALGDRERRVCTKCTSRAWGFSLASIPSRIGSGRGLCCLRRDRSWYVTLHCTANRLPAMVPSFSLWSVFYSKDS
jgi:hypothetical protein